jgi:hypothetical protein
MDQTVIDQEWTLEERRAFVKQPLDERRRQMRQQATSTAELYEQVAEADERVEWQGGDLGEHVQQ